MAEPLLEVKGLKVRFATEDGVVRAVDGVDFQLERGKVLGIVGESGSGKSVTAMTLLGLTRGQNAAFEGEVVYKGQNLLTMPESRLRDVRGDEIAMIFQDPMTSLNPVHSIGTQLIEATLLHQDVSKKQARKLAIEALKDVGIPRAERRIDDYPHQFSGGMRQRVMIAMALINDPMLLIADEPTTALDVTTQAQILELMRRLQEEHGTAIVMITHDLGVVAEVADEVVVMYAARVAERAPVDNIYGRPMHPYTWGLLGSLPRLETDVERLTQIPGQPPSLLRPPKGCRFNPRCTFAFDRCRHELPELVPTLSDPAHTQACFLDEETKLSEARRVLAAFDPEAAEGV
ncbi:MAG TPA: ABC transporter ATP-binding protein [Solirubrobacterales bacterium]|nr:ABC transporter ATP-binding protein [Solirubrobacterales bacterium]